MWLSTLRLLEEKNLITSQSILYLEYPSDLQLELGKQYTNLKHAKAGQVMFGLWTLDTFQQYN